MNEEYVLDNHCPTCGANLKFNPDSNSWKCEFCRVNYSLNDLQKYNNASSVQSNKNTEKEKVEQSDINKKLVVLKCKNCGAEIVCDDQVVATSCVYCRNTAIIKSKLSNEFKPDYVIPFKVSKQKAINAFKKINKGRKFVPNNFNDDSNINEIKGVYIPFWLYDVNVNGGMKFDAVKYRSWRVGDTHYTETSYYKLERDVSIDFNKIPVDGSTRFENDIMNSIEPFNYEELVEYNHAYLSGFLAERYDVMSNYAYLDAESRLMKTSKNQIEKSCVSFFSLRERENTLKNEIKSIKYALLPVWMVNVKYGDKIYIFAMNGQTGKFIGNIPLDKGKMILYFIKTFLISAVSIFILSYILYKVGV